MSITHTPGPWTLNTQYADIEVRGPADSGVLIAVMSPWGVHADTPNPQARNARLIAAAPDLLDALRILTLAYDMGRVDKLILDNARAAIKAAA